MREAVAKQLWSVRPAKKTPGGAFLAHPVSCSKKEDLLRCAKTDEGHEVMERKNNRRGEIFANHSIT